MLTPVQFFVSLWDDLQTRSKRPEERALSGELSLEQVKDRTSNAVGSDSDDGGLFDETIAAYKLRRKAAADYLVSALVDSHSKAFKAYVDRAHWTPASDEAVIDTSQLAITAELDEPLRVRQTLNLSFLFSFPPRLTRMSPRF